jgi:sulfate permease, SulP family
MTMNAAAAGRAAWYSPFLSFLKWLPLVNRESARSDFVAGLTGAIVVLPQSVAFATLAGMPPQYGLYAGMIPAVVAAVFGSSWQLVSGPTTAASIVLFSALSAHAEPASAHYVELALTLTIMVGLIELTLGLFKLGTIVNFISHSVVIGFTAGAGVIIAISQLRNFLGLPIPRGIRSYETIAFVATHLSNVSAPIVIAATATLIAGVLSRRFFPRVPYMIVAILAGSVVAGFLNARWPGLVPTVGALPTNPPPLSSPSFDPDVWRSLAPTAIAVTVFALTEALSIARALAVRTGQHIDASQEFVGQGLSNIAGAFFSGYVATGSFNRSGVNYEAGARTPLAAIFASVMLLLLVMFVAPYAAYLPNAAMAGVLMLVAYGLIDQHHIAQIMKTSRPEAGVMILTFLATLTVDLEDAIFVGMILSLMLYLNRTAKPRFTPLVPDPGSWARKFAAASAELTECKQFRIFRLDGSLFFGAVSAFTDTMRAVEEETPDCRYVAIEMMGVNFIDVGGAEAVVAAAKRIRQRGGALFLIHTKPEVMEFLKRGEYLDDIGTENFFFSKTEAIRTIYRRFDYSICRGCDRRPFVECARMGKQEPTEQDYEVQTAASD